MWDSPKGSAGDRKTALEREASIFSFILEAVNTHTQPHNQRIKGDELSHYRKTQVSLKKKQQPHMEVYEESRRQLRRLALPSGDSKSEPAGLETYHVFENEKKETSVKERMHRIKTDF